MAITYACDCCGHTADKEALHDRGFLDTHQYCDACVESVDATYKEIDDLHDRLSMAWEREKAEAVERWKTRNGNRGVFPDD